MTTREFYLSVLDMADTASATDPSMTFGGQSVVDLSTKATEMLSALDARNEKRKSAESKEKHETASRRETVLNSLCETPLFAETIAEANGLTVGQVRSALSTLVREGKASKTEVKDGKSRKMAYTLPTEA